MTDDTTATAAAEPGQASGKTGARPEPPRRRTTTAEEAGPAAEPAVNECEDCAEPTRNAAAGLGLLICAVAGGLLYIGLDLVTGGGLSRRLGGAREEDGQ